MKLLAFLLYGSLQAVRYKDCGTTGMKINDIKGTGYIIKSNASQKDIELLEFTNQESLLMIFSL